MIVPVLFVILDAAAGPGSINPVGLAFSLVMSLVLLVVPRRYAIIPVLVLVCFMTMGQHLIIANLNFSMIRIVLLFGWLRLLVKGEHYNLRWNTVDKLVIAWVILRTINYVIVWGSWAALINRLGYAYDILGSYFLFRFLVREPEDVYRAIRYIAMFVGPLALLMIFEKLTGRNAFAIFGAVALAETRGGVVRCQGPFGVSILAGTFGASMVPLFVGMSQYRRSTVLLILALLSAFLITTTSGSSGPILAFVAGITGLMFWPLRKQMQLVRWSLVAILVALQIVMSQPVWFIMARLTVFSGSTGWYRGFLIDMTFRHFSEWWLVGSNQNAKWHWFLADVTNQYIVEALGGGLVVMALFIAILAYSLRAIGKVVNSKHSTPAVRRLTWAMGASLFAHIVTFFSVSYFDQNFIVYYLLLAGIAAMSVPQSAPVPAQRPESLDVVKLPLHLPLPYPTR